MNNPNKTVLLALALISALCISCIALDETDGVSGDTYTDNQGIIYKANSDGLTATVSGHTETLPTSIIIPEKVSIIDSATGESIEYTVTSVNTGALLDLDNLENVELPGTLTSIGMNAFNGCGNLSTINLPDSVTSIGFQAFKDCRSLKSVNLPSSLTTLDKSSFAGCTSIKSFSIEDTNEKYNVVDGMVIENGINLLFRAALYPVTDCVIPDGVTSIQRYAFDGSNIASVNIPAGVSVSINSNTFYNTFSTCENLTEINVADDHETLSSVDGVVMGKGTGLLFFVPHGLTSYDVPSTVTSLGTYAFKENHTIKEVSFSGTPTLGSSIFQNCTSLESVTLPEGTETIPYQMFGGCTSLTTVGNIDGVKKIEGWAFQNCTSLKALEFPNDVEFSQTQPAFSGCAGLTVTVNGKAMLVDSDGNLGNPVLTYNGYAYASIEDAITAAPSDGSVASLKLNSDIQLEGLGVNLHVIEIPEDKNIELDLNGFKITTNQKNDGTHYNSFGVNGTFILKDNSDPSTGSIEARGIIIYEGGVFTLESGSIVCLDNASGAAVINNGKFTMTGGSISCTGNPDSEGKNGPVPLSNNATGTAEITGGEISYHLWNIMNSGSITVTGMTFENDTVGWMSFKNEGTAVLNNCTFKSVNGGGVESQNGNITLNNCSFELSTSSSVSWTTCCVAVSYMGSATLNDCSFNTPHYGFYVFSSGGTINVNSGTYTSTGDKNLFQLDVDKNSYPYAEALADIEGGSFTGALPVSLNQYSTISISGGQFYSSDNTPNTSIPTEFFATGYEINESTGQIILADDAECVATIVERQFPSLASAIAAAHDDDIIIIQDNIAESVTIPDTLAVTIDLNGFTITNSESIQDSSIPDAERKHTIINNGTLTIIDSSESKTGTVNNVSHSCGAVVNNGTFTLESGKLTRSAEAGISSSDNGGNSWYVVDNHGIMTIKGGVIEADGKYSSLIRNIGDSALDRSYLTIEGGSVSNQFIAVKNDDYGTLSITNGTITSPEQSVQNWSVATISGGDLNGDVTTITYVLNNASTDGSLIISGGDIEGDIIAGLYDTKAEPPEVKIESGKITGQLRTTSGTSMSDPVTDADWIQVSGGSFTEPVADRFIAPGSALSFTNGTYSVSVAHKVTFSVNVTDYTLTVSQDGSTVTYQPEADGSYILADGTYKVVVNKDGYNPFETTFSVSGEERDVSIIMTPVIVEPDTHSVDFYVQGKVVGHFDIVDGQTVPTDQIPSVNVDGYVFDHWEFSGQEWKPETPVTSDMEIHAYLVEMENVKIIVTGDTYIGETVTLTVDFDTAGYEVINIGWGYGTTSDIDDTQDYGNGPSVTATQTGYYFVALIYSNGTDVHIAIGSTHLVFTDAPSLGGDDTPIIPPFDNDDDYVPLPPQIVVEDDGDDDTVKVAACAAAAVAAAIIALILVAEYRKN